MQKRSKKPSQILLVFLLLLPLLALLLCGLLLQNSQDKVFPLFLRTNDEYGQVLSPYKADDGTWYFFLPSYRSGENAVLTSDGSVTYGDVCVEALPVSDFSLNQTYTFVQKGLLGTKERTVVFLKSANVATLYIQTATGNLDTVYRDKSNTEPALLHLYDENGVLNYAGNSSDRIKGRGNSTWRLDKKPFRLLLNQPVGLLGMSPALHYNLLANATDETNLRNRIVMDSATLLSEEWNPACRYVDLYLNGEYNGLYLLTESIEVTQNRVELHAEKDFLFEVALEIKIEDPTTSQYAFTTPSGRGYLLNYPAVATDERRGEIVADVIAFESEISAGDFSRLDLDSFARRFLFNEIFGNVDTDIASAYYCYDSQTDKYYCGPIWDYDLSLGNVNPAVSIAPFAADPEQLYSASTPPNSWVNILYRSEVFRQRLKELYREEFVPLITELLSERLDDYIDTVATASRNNTLRWDGMFQTNDALRRDGNLDTIAAFLAGKMAYLEKIWFSGDTYHPVTFYDYDGVTGLKTMMVKDGETVTDADSVLPDGFTSWQNVSTGEAEDFSSPITSALAVYAVGGTHREYRIWTWFDVFLVENHFYVALAFVAVFIIAFVCLLIAGIRKGGRHGRT